MILLKELVEQVLEESTMGYIPAWMDNRGEVIRVTSHADFGAETLQMGLDPMDFDDIEKIYDGMYSKGYVRVTIEPNQIMYDYDTRPPSRIQLRTLKDTGITKNLVVSDAVSGRILYSPHR